MAESGSAKRTKRRLRAPTQTVRQRAEKAQVAADKPARVSRVRTTAGKAKTPLRAASKLFDRPPLRFVGKALRFIGRIVFPNYFRTAWQELRLVEWPNRKQSRRLTFAVLGFAIVFGAAIAIVDYGLDKVFRSILLK